MAHTLINLAFVAVGLIGLTVIICSLFDTPGRV